jgi:predicted ATPase
MAELISTFHKAALSRAQTVLIRGEPGIGKTALLEHFADWCKTQPKVRLARAGCIQSVGLDAPWQPVIDLIAGLLILPGKAILRMLFDSAPTILIQFRHVLPPPERDKISEPNTAGANTGGMLLEICEFIEGLASANLLVLLLEDVQWADPDTLGLISALARRSAHARLLVVLTVRRVSSTATSENFRAFENDLRFRRLCTTIELDALTSVAARSCLGDWLSGPIEAGDASALNSLAGGNPLVLRALCDYLHGVRGLALDGEQWRLTLQRERVPERIPDDLLEVLCAELARLTEYELQLLRAGSVAGVMFTSWAVSAILGEPVEIVESACALLVRSHQIIEPAAKAETGSPIAAAYSFRNALYREALLRQIGSERCGWHRRLAEQIERVHAANLEGMAAEIGWHFEQSRDWARAIQYLRLAARYALARLEGHQAIKLLCRALALYDRLPADESNLFFELLDQLADAYMAVGDATHVAETRESAARARLGVR